MNVTLPLPLLCCMFFLFPFWEEVLAPPKHTELPIIHGQVLCEHQLAVEYKVIPSNDEASKLLGIWSSFFPMARWRLVSRKKDVPQNAIGWFGKWSNLVSQTWCNTRHLDVWGCLTCAFNLQSSCFVANHAAFANQQWPQGLFLSIGKTPNLMFHKDKRMLNSRIK